MGRNPRTAATVAGAALVLAGVPLVAAPPAHAVVAGQAYVAAGTLYFEAPLGVASNVDFLEQSDGDWVVQDLAADVTAGPGCVQGAPNWVTCTGVIAVAAYGYDLDDVFGVRETGLPPGAAWRTGTAATAVAQVPVTLVGGTGNDTLEGGYGDDVLDGGPGADTLIGHQGIDTVTYERRTAGVVADADGVGDDGEPGERDNIATDVENLIGGAGPDTLTGSAAANLLVGGSGVDNLRGLDGADRLDGGAGLDYLNGGSHGRGADVCIPGADGARTRGCEVLS